MKTWPIRLPGADAEFERLLLDSARDDDAPMDARARVAAGLGIDIGRLDIDRRRLDVGSQGADSRGDAFARGARARSENVNLDALIKYTLIGIVGGLATLSTGAETSEVNAPFAVDAPVIDSLASRDEPDRLEPYSPPVGESSKTVVENVRRQQQPHAMTVTAPRGATTPDRAVPARRVRVDSAAKTSDPPAAQLLAEVKQLDRVRAALQASQNEAALRELDAYDARFPRGALAVEALVLRVRTLQRAGQFAFAARLARRALTLPGSERYHSELDRLVTAE